MKRAFLAATAIVMSSFASVTPALASEVGDNGLVGLPGETAQQVCERALRPNENSGFQTAPVYTEVGAVLSSVTVRDTNPFQQIGTGTPSYSNFSNHRDFFRNGGSPNVWAIADAGVTNYPSSDLYYHTTVTDTIGDLFGCETWKDPGGPGKGPDSIYPPGLQTTGHSAITGTDTYAGADVIDPNGGPVSEGGTPGVSILVCISPNTTGGKPGQWRGMHDFATAGCPAASIAAAGTVPSGNNPD